MSHNWGYKQGAKMAKDMGLGKVGPSVVTVKTHVRAPRMAKMPPAPAPSANANPVKAYKKGGKVSKKGC